MASNAAATSPNGKRLKSWKQIAGFFGTTERTVKRWEVTRGLPVHRIPGARGSVYADVTDLEQWLIGDRPPLTATPQRRKYYWWAAGGALLLVPTGLIVAGLGQHSTVVAAEAPRHRPTQQVADLYFAGRYNFERRTPESLNRAVALFNEAIRRDPNYAEAYAGLANCHLLLREYAGVPDAVAYANARAAAERALLLDEHLADAHAALAFVVFFNDRNFAAGLADFRRAVALNPNSGGIRHWYANALAHTGDFAAALTEINAAQRLEPQSQAILADKALIMFAAGRAPEAIASLRQMEAADPAYLSPHTYLASFYLVQGDYPAFLAEQRIITRLTGDQDRASVAAAAERGYRAGGAPAMFAAMAARQRDLHAAGREHAFMLATTYAIAGQKAEAMAALRMAVSDRDPYLVGLRLDARFAPLHGDPEFRRLALSVGGG